MNRKFIGVKKGNYVLRQQDIDMQKNEFGPPYLTIHTNVNSK